MGSEGAGAVVSKGGGVGMEMRSESRWGHLGALRAGKGAGIIPRPADSYRRHLRMGAMRSTLLFKKDYFGCWVNPLEG